MEKCPACGGVEGGCEDCDQLGIVDAPDPRKLVEGTKGRRHEGTECPEDLPGWLIATSQVIGAWSGIKQYGLAGWMTLAGIAELDVDLLEALGVMDAEYARLEHGARVEEAMTMRRRMKQ